VAKGSRKADESDAVKVGRNDGGEQKLRNHLAQVMIDHYQEASQAQ
jgi:hypothetical protein